MDFWYFTLSLSLSLAWRYTITMRVWLHDIRHQLDCQTLNRTMAHTIYSFSAWTVITSNWKLEWAQFQWASHILRINKHFSFSFPPSLSLFFCLATSFLLSLLPLTLFRLIFSVQQCCTKWKRQIVTISIINKFTLFGLLYLMCGTDEKVLFTRVHLNSLLNSTHLKAESLIEIDMPLNILHGFHHFFFQ